jgi:tetratricopeptide (TPR) repeat protein
MERFLGRMFGGKKPATEVAPPGEDVPPPDAAELERLYQEAYMLRAEGRVAQAEAVLAPRAGARAQHFHLARLYAELAELLGATAEAAARWESICAHRAIPDDQWQREAHARAILNRAASGDHAAAQTLAEAALALFPAEARIMASCAGAAESRGDRPGAAALWQRAVDLAPDDTAYQEGLRRTRLPAEPSATPVRTAPGGPRIVVLVLAYLQNAAGMERLARYFATIDAELLVHVDAKVDDSAYRDAAKRHANLRLMAERLPIYWGGFNTVRAILRAAELAVAAGPFDRLVLITEDTIPLLAPQDVRRRLASAVEFMHLVRRPGPAVQRRYRGFYFFDSLATNPRHCDPADRELNDDVITSLERLRALRARGKASVDLCHGSTYWALSREAIMAVLERHERDAHVRESFEFSSIPEEQYFHTILGGALPGRHFAPCLYADFSRPPHPYVFTTQADILSRPQAGAEMFLRKTDMGSAEIEGFVESLRKKKELLS